MVLILPSLCALAPCLQPLLILDSSRALLYRVGSPKLTPRKDTPVKNSFVKQFDPNIKFNYSCFDRVILRGYIIRLFFAGGIAVLLRALGFNSLSNGVMRILTDQLNSHIEKIAKARQEVRTPLQMPKTRQAILHLLS